MLEQVIARAIDAGHRVRFSSPGPHERHFAYGVMRALVEAPLHEADEAERGRLLEGAAAQAGDLLLSGAVPGPHATTSIAHSMLWVCAALTDRAAPLMLVVDDAHWADRPSLEVLSYLARRVRDVPVLIVLAFRPDVPESASDLLSLVPDAPMEICQRCHVAAHGNPWLVGELGHQVASHGPGSLRLGAAGETTVRALARDVIAGRLAALSPADRAVSAAFAVLGDRAQNHVVAAVAGVPLDALGAARDALGSAGLLGPDARGLAHALIGAAIIEGLPRAEAERLHRVAAWTLRADGAESDVVAGHLLRSAPCGDSEASAVLQDAAARATLRGAPHAAAAYLQGALEERAPGDDRGALAGAVGGRDLRRGAPWSARALAGGGDPPRRGL